MYLFCNKYGKGKRFHIDVCGIKQEGKPCPYLRHFPIFKTYECTFVSESEKRINKKSERKKHGKK